MQVITTIGLDIAKSVFQVHGVNAGGQVVMRRQLKRWYVLTFFQKLPPCLVGIEACASSHHWSRELLARGHTARLMPPAGLAAFRARAILPIFGLPLGFLEISQVRRCLILLCGHEQTIRTRKIVLLTNKDLGVVLWAADFGPVRPRIGVANIFLVGGPGAR